MANTAATITSNIQTGLRKPSETILLLTAPFIAKLLWRIFGRLVQALSSNGLIWLRLTALTPPTWRLPATLNTLRRSLQLNNFQKNLFRSGCFKVGRCCETAPNQV